ncbi:acyl-CoA dehydrogenase family protein [Aliiruegeria lutimaris]|uniref:Acyl-CoA dehydrogenase n=1 Tax=Aliiruegeria lutimaris TaxID=571298 RepID=A0A1G9GW67_9RHOB|nr:acyl-CoA dehydrogenase family protein [Aliiruegeria lutimaris]SDL04533.1 Acyl-CoA dehydrogenase [Aliiruegeria lutimaris]
MSQSIHLDHILQEVGPAIESESARLDASEGFIGRNYDLLRERRVFSALIPQDYGGGGATHAEMCEFVRGLGRSCPSTALTLAMHQHLVSAAVANNRAGRPGRALLDKVVAAELILVSTGANDWLESNGSAKKVDGGYRVSAMKPFASGVGKGDVMVTSVSFDDPVEGPQVLHFPVPLDSEGITLLGDWQTLGMRATGSQTVRFEDVFVPDAAIAMKRPRGGFHPAFSVILTVALPLIMSAYLGTAEAAVAIALEKANNGRDDVSVQLLVGEMNNLLTTASIARNDLIRLCNNLDFQPTEGLAAEVLTRKTICANHVIATVEKSMELAGGAAFMRKTGIERFLRDAHGARYHPLPEKRQQVLTGRLQLGLPPVEMPEPVLQAAE